MRLKFKFLVIGSALAFLSLSGISSAAARTCRVPNVTPQVTFSIVPYKVTFRNGSTRRDLKRISRRHNNSTQPLGLTVTTFSYRVAPKVVGYPMKGGRYCALPTEINIKMGYPTFEVLIDRRYRHGTCQFNAILDHENEHVDLYLHTLDRMTPWLESQILGEIDRIKPLIVTSIDRAAQHFTQLLMRKIKAAAAKLSRAAARANARIDTDESYRTTQAQCRKW